MFNFAALKSANHARESLLFVLRFCYKMTSYHFERDDGLMSQRVFTGKAFTFDTSLYRILPSQWGYAFSRPSRGIRSVRSGPRQKVKITPVHSKCDSRNKVVMLKPASKNSRKTGRKVYCS
ncbi:hypothetical protein P692DRAFT_20587945 [Suillus brevipes Sb2]|nr:hypothetical protein P692DRAFT_20587945 [Suillus brevipes Sb2]